MPNAVKMVRTPRDSQERECPSPKSPHWKIENLQIVRAGLRDAINALDYTYNEGGYSFGYDEELQELDKVKRALEKQDEALWKILYKLDTGKYEK